MIGSMCFKSVEAEYQSVSHGANVLRLNYFTCGEKRWSVDCQRDSSSWRARLIRRCRMSPSTTVTSKVLRKGRLARLPFLKKLSKPQISIPGRTDGNSRAKQAPVMRIFTVLSRLGQFQKRYRRGSWSDPRKDSGSAFWRDRKCSRCGPLPDFCRRRWRAFSCPLVFRLGQRLPGWSSCWLGRRRDYKSRPSVVFQEMRR